MSKMNFIQNSAQFSNLTNYVGIFENEKKHPYEGDKNCPPCIRWY